MTAPSSKRINSNTVTKTLITELDILRFNQRFFACLRGISCDFPWKFELWQADCIQIIHATYVYSGGGVSLPCSRFLDVTQRSFQLCVYYNQFLVAVPSMHSRHARSSHTVLVRVYLQGYGLFIQIFLGEVQFATLCEDTTVQ